MKATANAVCAVTGQAAAVDNEVCWVDSLQTHEISTNTITLDGGIEIPFHIRISADGSGAIASVEGNEAHASAKLTATLAPVSIAINPVIINPVYGCRPGTGERFFKSGELKIPAPGATLNLTLGVSLTGNVSASTGFVVTGLGFNANFDNNLSSNLSYGDISIDLANGGAWGLPPEPTFSQVSMVYDQLVHSLIQRMTQRANEKISGMMLTAADGIIITFQNGVARVTKKVDQVASIPPAKNSWSQMAFKTMVGVGLSNVPVCGPSLTTFFNLGTGTYNTPPPMPPSGMVPNGGKAPGTPMTSATGAQVAPPAGLPQPRMGQSINLAPSQVQRNVNEVLQQIEQSEDSN